ncbi:hypothetical protein QO209_10775 [Pseudomonas citronellolis]|uniref:hypothetical protein n=1 Tax=Pseudomonas citronellolis TaxID=53408 RepID=UPI002647322F|nr:hypothetical protein [Pseudomonas citronellolis]MDN6872929.1 hypothetical protein [Pseudomonas citronellolis]
MSVRERPILFKDLMVRAIRDGRKTVTRRLVDPAPIGDMRWNEKQRGAAGARIASWIDDVRMYRCPFGEVGDRLWVREAWLPDPSADDVAWDDWTDTYYSWSGCGSRIDGVPPALRSPEHCIYREGWTGGGLRWRPSIHMPRWASRILLEVTEVRVERLQDGEGETAFESRYLAEGLFKIHHGDGDYYYSAFHSEPTPKDWCWPEDAFRELWEFMNGGILSFGSWSANPWVWVVEFKVLEGRA